MTNIEQDAITPVIWHDMPEASADPSSVLPCLARLLKHDIPAFVIRWSESMGTSLEAHDHNVGLLKAGISRLHPKKELEAAVIDGFTGLGTEAIGLFHSDMGDPDQPYDDTQIEVNTTLAGGGQVISAAPGPDIKRIWVPQQHGPTNRRSGRPTHPHSLLLAGKVDASLTSKHVYRTNVRAGDTVVQTGNSSHASWHRFDTDHTIGMQRQVKLTVILETSRQYLKRQGRWIRNREYQLGLDL